MADSTKYNGSTWEHSLRKLTTATEAVENPLYSDGTAITSYTIKGNTVQNGTPTPSNPVDVVGVGELETTGEHTGEYKIPISSGDMTNNIYLGSTSGIRIIKKFVCTGAASENWGYNVSFYTSDVTDYMRNMGNITCVCTHYPASGQTGGSSYVTDMTVSFLGNTNADRLYIRDSNYTSITEFKNYLAQQYANGTPVTVWYVLQAATTGIVNEPLMKVGTFADTLSNATSIPTTDGANSITVDTTVQPSEFTATWSGWHNASVQEYDGSDWT